MWIMQTNIYEKVWYMLVVVPVKINTEGNSIVKCMWLCQHSPPILLSLSRPPSPHHETNTKRIFPYQQFSRFGFFEFTCESRSRSESEHGFNFFHSCHRLKSSGMFSHFATRLWAAFVVGAMAKNAEYWIIRTQNEASRLVCSDNW